MSFGGTEEDCGYAKTISRFEKSRGRRHRNRQCRVFMKFVFDQSVDMICPHGFMDVSPDILGVRKTRFPTNFSSLWRRSC